jgi:energy-coupling factor transporter transmembrane protein EcfT
MNRLTPAVKGVITALLMIGATLLYDRYHLQADPRFQYLIYVIYLIGVVWTILPFQGSFGELFSTGFRNFVVVTIIMVIFTFVFVKMHPELANQERITTIAYYQEKGDKTPQEIEEIGEKAKKQYNLAVVSLSIFRYLIIGAVFSLGTAAVLSRRK